MNLIPLVSIMVKIILYGVVAFVVFFIFKAIYRIFKPMIDEIIKPLLKRKGSINKDNPKNIQEEIKKLEKQVEEYKSLEKYQKDKEKLELKLGEVNLKLRRLKEGK